MIRARGFLCVGLVLVLAAATWAGPVRHDSFILAVEPDGDIAGGGGTGYTVTDPAGGTAGPWFAYPSGWINQWFWNDPFTWGWKWIEFDIAWNKMILMDDVGLPTPPGVIEIAINWSTPEWSLVGNTPGTPRVPPLPGTDEDLYIHRELVAAGPVEFVSGGYHIKGRIVIPDYNPEWVSIDVRGRNFQIIGTIDHQCVPLPSAAMSGLGLLGVLALGSGRRMRRCAA